MRTRAKLACLVLLGAAGCSAPDRDEGGVRVGQTSEDLTAVCEANVRGVGMIPAETQYLPHVVHCENGGAPIEALRVQAIAARTYLYYKMETSGSIGDGQGDQVYSCGSGPTAEQIQAVKDTEGLVLRYSNTTICSFFVAGGAASPPSCKGGVASTEGDVTYNEGLSGASIHQTPLGFVSPSNYRNRGCMSQLGSRCLAGEGKSYEQILQFYYGADIELVRSTGPCVTPPPVDAGKDAHADGATGADGGARHDAANGDDGGAGGGGGGGNTDAAEAPDGSPSADGGAFLADTPSGGSSDGCAASGREPASAGASWLVALAAVIRARRRTRARRV